MFDPLTIFAAFAPVVIKTGEALIQRYITPDTIKPSNIADVVALRTLDNSRFQILQDADKGGDTYKWVEAVRKLQRPFVVGVLIVAFVLDPNNLAVSLMSSSVTFYLFGERIMLGGAK